MIWQFPKYDYSLLGATESALRLQHNKCYEELDEVFYALVRDKEPPERIIEETLDVLHSVETLLRLELDFFNLTDEDMLFIKRELIDKNKERGYYGKE